MKMSCEKLIICNLTSNKTVFIIQKHNGQILLA